MLHAENLALIHGAHASCSARAIDDSIKDVNYIVEDHPLGENGPYPYCSTYTGDVSAGKVDWWAVTFPYTVRCNAVGFTHGKVEGAGGYWTQLEVQAQREPGGPWTSVSDLRSYPAYDLSDRRGNRRPFESYMLVFAPVEAVAVRLHGRPGGALRFTTLMRLGVYDLDLSLWDPSQIPAAPVPRLFRLLEPERLSQIFFDLQAVTGIMMTAETPAQLSVALDSFLDWDLYRQFVALDPRQTTRLDEFERLLFDAEGGHRFMQPLNDCTAAAAATREPVLQIHHGGLGFLVVPVVVREEVIGLLTSCTHFFCDGPDMDWHQAHARELGIDWGLYRRSLAQLPSLPRSRLQAMLHLLSIVANTIAELADTSLRREQQVREMERTIRELSEREALIVEEAVSYMAANLGEPLTLRDVAGAVAVSPRHLTRLFNRVAQRSPMESLTDLRLDRAAELLRTSEKRVTDVCTEVGYSSLSHFVRLFTRRFGVTPGRYARQARSRAT